MSGVVVSLTVVAGLFLSHCPDGSRSATDVSFTETRVTAVDKQRTGEPEFIDTFKYSGCYDIENPDEHRLEAPEMSGMTPQKCFSFCNGKDAPAAAQPTDTPLKVKFFLLSGSDCTCLHYIDKNKANSLNEKLCQMPCDGDKREMCGGPSRDSVYVMMKCEKLPPSATELERERQMNQTLEDIGVQL